MFCSGVDFSDVRSYFSSPIQFSLCFLILTRPIFDMFWDLGFSPSVSIWFCVGRSRIEQSYLRPRNRCMSSVNSVIRMLEKKTVTNVETNMHCFLLFYCRRHTPLEFQKNMFRRLIVINDEASPRNAMLIYLSMQLDNINFNSTMLFVINVSDTKHIVLICYKNSDVHEIHIFTCIWESVFQFYC